jgi:hypothetical protein
MSRQSATKEEDKVHDVQSGSRVVEGPTPVPSLALAST